MFTEWYEQNGVELVPKEANPLYFPDSPSH